MGLNRFMHYLFGTQSEIHPADLAPAEIWGLIFKHLLYTPSIGLIKNMATLRLVDKEFKRLFDAIFEHPKNIISLLINETSAKECFQFLEQFQKTDLFNKLKNIKPQEDPLGYICFALTTEDTKLVNLDQLVQTIFAAKDLFHPKDFEYLQLIRFVQQSNNKAYFAARDFFQNTRTPFLLGRFLTPGAYDLRNLQAPYTDFSYLNLNNANLRNANLTHCTFYRTNLGWAILIGCDITNACFKDIITNDLTIVDHFLSTEKEGQDELRAILDKLFVMLQKRPDSTFAHAIAWNLNQIINTFPLNAALDLLDKVILKHPFFLYSERSQWHIFSSSYPSERSGLEILKMLRRFFANMQESRRHVIQPM